MSTDRFLGHWEMDVDSNVYERGIPPIEGNYIIEQQENGYLVKMHWTTPDGQDMSSSYTAIPDGHEYPIDGAGVDHMSMTRVNEHILDSDAFKDGVLVLRGRRVLSEDGQQMTITQSGKTPSGEPFTNLSIYRRVK